MKRLDTFLLVLSAMLFGLAACTQDEGNSCGCEEAALSVRVKAAGAVATKGFHPNDEHELPGEAKVNNLSVLVFNEDGTQLVCYDWQDTKGAEGEVELQPVHVPAAKAQIVLVSNTPSNSLVDVADYADFESRLSLLADQKRDNLVMSSRVVVTLKPLGLGNNYIGYEDMGDRNVNGIDQPIELTRLAARLDLVNVKTDFTRAVLRGRTVRIEEVKVLNRNTASRYFSPDYWGVVMAKGHLDDSEPFRLDRNIANGAPIADTPFVQYVMENDASEAATEIEVRATLLETDRYKAERKVFTAVINRNGLERGYNHNFIKRNYVYRLSVTFGDGSFDGNHEKPTRLIRDLIPVLIPVLIPNHRRPVLWTYRSKWSTGAK